MSARAKKLVYCKDLLVVLLEKEKWTFYCQISEYVCSFWPKTTDFVVIIFSFQF